MLSLGNIDLSAFKFYTGLKDRQLFELLYKELELNASRLKYWISTDKGSISKGRPRDLALKDQLFMVLFRLRTGTCGKETARNFGVSESTISRTFCTWINFLELAAMTFPTLEQVQQHMPESVHFSQRVLDCIEVRIQKPSGLNTRKQIFSIYKHYNTFKVLVGATPDGYLCFLSELWEAMLVIQKLSREVVW